MDVELIRASRAWRIQQCVDSQRRRIGGGLDRPEPRERWKLLALTADGGRSWTLVVPSTPALAAYLDGWGASSVKGAIDTYPFTACDSARVATAKVEPIQVADVIYNGATFTVEVTGRGGA